MPEDKLGPVARRLAASERVMCVEDEPDIALFLRAYFRAAGYDLVHVDARSAAEVIGAIAEHEPDIVLLDLHLNGFSGMEVYKQLRADERWAFTPVIIVSAHAENDPAFERPTGIDTVVSKPFNTNTLADVVRERIDTARALAEVGRSETLQLLTQDYLIGRIADEITVGPRDPFCFALVRLRSITDVRAVVGENGLDHLAAKLLADARAALPANSVIGITNKEEIAVLLPGMAPRDGFAALNDVLAAATGEFTFAGGAVVPVVLAGGLASYPAHAASPDELFMAADAALEEAIDDDALLHLAL